MPSTSGVQSSIAKCWRSAARLRRLRADRRVAVYRRDGSYRRRVRRLQRVACVTALLGAAQRGRQDRCSSLGHTGRADVLQVIHNPALGCLTQSGE